MEWIKLNVKSIKPSLNNYASHVILNHFVPLHHRTFNQMNLIKTLKNLQTINFVITIIKCDFLVLKSHAHATATTKRHIFCINFTCIACNLLWCAQFPITYYITWHDNSQKSRFIFSRLLFKSEIISKLRTRKSEKVSYFFLYNRHRLFFRTSKKTSYCLQERFTFFPLHDGHQQW